MTDPKTPPLPPEAFSLFDKYVHGLISRRDFIDRASALAVAGLSGASLLDVLNPKFAQAQQVAPTDERINAAWPAYEKELQAAGVKYQAHVYPGTQHGFNNDTTPRFDKDAAALAWQRTISFFNEQLRT